VARLGAWKASQEAIEQLMDHEWPEDKKARFIEVLAMHPELRGVHDLRTRTSGNQDFVQFHVWIDGNMTVTHAHKVMDEIEAKLKTHFPDVEILIHPDPEGHVGESGVMAEDILKGFEGRRCEGLPLALPERLPTRWQWCRILALRLSTCAT
jgi:ferrous-iron efflux pump FieF